MFSARHRSSRIAAEQVRPIERPLVIGNDSPHDCRPQVDVVPVNDQLTEIRITCRCGEEIVLACSAPSISET
ncbi:MAG: hypothetical protein ACK5Q5_16330 [Planctomycetaceae bacterium]